MLQAVPSIHTSTFTMVPVSTILSVYTPNTLACVARVCTTETKISRDSLVFAAKRRALVVLCGCKGFVTTSQMFDLRSPGPLMRVFHGTYTSIWSALTLLHRYVCSGALNVCALGEFCFFDSIRRVLTFADTFSAVSVSFPMRCMSICMLDPSLCGLRCCSDHLSAALQLQ